MEFLTFFDQIPGLSSILSFLPAALQLGNLIFGSTLATLIVAAIFYLLYRDTGKRWRHAASLTAHIVVPWMLLVSVLKGLDAIIMRPYLHAPALVLIGLVALFWAVLPHIWLWTKMSKLPRRVKIKASICFIKSYFIGLVQVPFSMSAWFVVPIILLFVKKEDNQLPGIFEKLYGDINGMHGDSTWWIADEKGRGVKHECAMDPNTIQVDHRTGEPKTMVQWNYWLEGVFQRTYSSRLAWLLRNRSTKMAYNLGVEVKDYEDYQHWDADKKIGSTDGLGWWLIMHKGNVDMMGVMYVGSLFGKFPICARVRYGYKLGNLMGPLSHQDYDLRYKRAEVINIACSFKGYKGVIPA